ncbi:MAG: protein kinase [Kibdelosporangium sp.]
MVTSDDELVQIGAGPVATVYGGLYVALKVYPGPVGERVMAAIEEEQARLAPLRDSVPLLLADELVELADGKFALQMELCTTSLAGLVADGGELLVPDVLAVGHAVAVAVAAAHRVGVVHGGLTPHNVLLHPAGAPVVADFGVALREAFPRDTESEAGYLAPETVRDGARNEWTDLYGIGVVLVLALTGHGPTSSAGPAGPVSVPPGDGVPAELVRLVSRLLAENPADRPATADVVVRQLSDMLASADPQPAPAEPEASLVAAVAPARTARRKWTGAVIGIAVSLSVLAAGLVFLLRPEPAALLPVPPVGSAPQSGSSAAPIALTLADPADLSSYVELSWQAPQGLTFGVVVAVENEATRVVMADQSRTMRIPVDPVRKYCFQIQATDGQRVLQSEPKPLRGAVCRT